MFDSVEPNYTDSMTSAEALKQFSREAFERSGAPEHLCDELERVLLLRLETASDRLAEAHAIVCDLRSAGHVLWSWDESHDLSIWGDDYRNPPLPTRILIEMRWPSEDEPSKSVEVAVTFGPWPKSEKPR